MNEPKMDIDIADGDTMIQEFNDRLINQACKAVLVDGSTEEVLAITPTGVVLGRTSPKAEDPMCVSIRSEYDLIFVRWERVLQIEAKA